MIREAPAVKPDTPISSVKTISVEEAFARWDEFVSAVKTARINLGSILSQSKLVDVKNGCVQLSCENDFQFNTLRRSKEYLGEISKRVFGTATPFEISMNEGGVKHNGEEKNEKEHPVIEAMRRELGAEPM